MKLPLFAMLVVLTGCYTYVRTPESPVAGREFSLHLTDAGSAQLAGELGAGVLAVQGRVTTVDNQGLGLAATGVVRRGGHEKWSGEYLTIPRALIATSEERKISVWRSTAFAGLIALGGFVISRTITEVLGDPERGGSSPKPPPET
ncbi:MAG TPA: hypothetical protein VES88_16180 [Gemmatimonadaceae bacterium]|nr:hypothetical protein [Gemmatimonadaceae bacterium]